jgi:hypothetical protein
MASVICILVAGVCFMLAGFSFYANLREAGCIFLGLAIVLAALAYILISAL